MQLFDTKRKFSDKFIYKHRWYEELLLWIKNNEFFFSASSQIRDRKDIYKYMIRNDLEIFGKKT